MGAGDLPLFLGRLDAPAEKEEEPRRDRQEHEGDDREEHDEQHARKRAGVFSPTDQMIQMRAFDVIEEEPDDFAAPTRPAGRRPRW